MDLRAIIIGFIAGGAGWAFVQFMARHYLSSYLSEKGRNLATKQDVQVIT
jgi:hypothetical protein